MEIGKFAINGKFRAEIDFGVVASHEGDSSSILQTFADGYFNVVYLDADHSCAGVKKDIHAAIPKVKQDGFLVFNDYTYWSPVECMQYGVIQAVNELCLEAEWEMVYFALAWYMYCEVALRRRQTPA
jgi:hypothetical protein